MIIGLEGKRMKLNIDNMIIYSNQSTNTKLTMLQFEYFFSKYKILVCASTIINHPKFWVYIFDPLPPTVRLSHMYAPMFHTTDYFVSWVHGATDYLSALSYHFWNFFYMLNYGAIDYFQNFCRYSIVKLQGLDKFLRQPVLRKSSSNRALLNFWRPRRSAFCQCYFNRATKNFANTDRSFPGPAFSVLNMLLMHYLVVTSKHFPLEDLANLALKLDIILLSS